MATQSIATLKSWFVTGAKPTEAQFSDLIDSFLHKSALPLQLAAPANNKFVAGDGSAIQTWNQRLHNSGYIARIATDAAMTANVQSATLMQNTTSKAWAGLTNTTHYYADVVAVGDSTIFANSDASDIADGTPVAPYGIVQDALEFAVVDSDATSTAWPDLGPNGKDVTMTGSPVLGPNGVEFTGAETAYLSSPVVLSGSYTLAIAGRITSYSNNELLGNDVAACYGFYCAVSGTYHSQGSAYAALSDVSTSTAFIMPLNTDFAYTLTFDRSTGDVKVYDIANTLVAVANIPSPAASIAINNLLGEGSAFRSKAYYKVITIHSKVLDSVERASQNGFFLTR